MDKQIRLPRSGLPHVVSSDRSVDVALVAGVVARDDSALESIYRKYDGAVHSIAGKVLRDDALAGDFVGDFIVDDVTVAQVLSSADGRGFVIPTESLDPLDEARTYQLWVINNTGDVISAGVLGHAPGPSTFTWTGEISGFASPVRSPASSSPAPRTSPPRSPLPDGNSAAHR